MNSVYDLYDVCIVILRMFIFQKFKHIWILNTFATATDTTISCIVLNETILRTLKIKYGVPQVSYLGHLIFSHCHCINCASNFPLADLSQILHEFWVCYDIAKIKIKIGGHHINFFYHGQLKCIAIIQI